MPQPWGINADAWPIGHKAWYCTNPECPESIWPGLGEFKLQGEEHFDHEGNCKHREGKPCPSTSRKSRQRR